MRLPSDNMDDSQLKQVMLSYFTPWSRLIAVGGNKAEYRINSRKETNRAVTRYSGKQDCANRREAGAVFGPNRLTPRPIFYERVQK
jgi:hypothetical protein